jgi:hypothetical protein
MGPLANSLSMFASLLEITSLNWRSGQTIRIIPSIFYVGNFEGLFCTSVFFSSFKRMRPRKREERKLWRDVKQIIGQQMY